MATVQDVINKMTSIHSCAKLFGYAADFPEKHDRIVGEIRQAIMEEQSVDEEQFQNVPMETPLGAKAEAAFQELCALLP